MTIKLKHVATLTFVASIIVFQGCSKKPEERVIGNRTSVSAEVVSNDLANDASLFREFNMDDKNQDSNKTKPFAELIKEYAESLKVFPIDIFARWGPLTAHVEWGNRYDLTSDQYAILHDLKETVYSVSLDELRDCTKTLGKMSVKEKALTLTAIFLFEKIHRKFRFRFEYESVYPPFFSKYIMLANVSNEKWRELVQHIEVYKNNTEVAFSALTEDIDTMIEKWKADRNRCEKEYASFDLPSFEYEWTSQKALEKKLEELQDLKEKRKLRILQEYFCLLHGSMFLSGIAPQDGNSSATPKTLGDIATQLLRSRLPYDDDEK